MSLCSLLIVQLAAALVRRSLLVTATTGFLASLGGSVVAWWVWRCYSWDICDLQNTQHGENRPLGLAFFIRSIRTIIQTCFMFRYKSYSHFGAGDIPMSQSNYNTMTTHSESMVSWLMRRHFGGVGRFNLTSSVSPMIGSTHAIKISSSESCRRSSRFATDSTFGHFKGQLRCTFLWHWVPSLSSTPSLLVRSEERV